MNTERVMERVRRLLAIANDPAASDNAIQEQMIYRALCHEATMRGKWIGQ